MSAGPGGGPQVSPDFEEARQVSAEIIAGQRMTMSGPRWMTMYEQKLLAETVDTLLSEREAREKIIGEVAYLLDPDCGAVLPAEAFRVIRKALPATESAQAEGER